MFNFFKLTFLVIKKLLVLAVILYKKHLVKYFCHLALAHVQYNLYDNVFAFLCPISSLSPSSLLQRSGLEAYHSNQCDLGQGASPLPAPVAVSPFPIPFFIPLLPYLFSTP